MSPEKGYSQKRVSLFLSVIFFYDRISNEALVHSWKG